MSKRRLYTRTGDAGSTALFGAGRVSKADSRVEAYGSVDELNAVLGWVNTMVDASEIGDALAIVQRDLFAIGAHLATPPGRRSPKLPPLPSERIDEIERWIDTAEDAVPELTAFILPGGSPPAAALHVARTVCRRAERRVVDLSLSNSIDAVIIMYLNRLSDWLFAAARLANHRAGIADREWHGIE